MFKNIVLVISGIIVATAGLTTIRYINYKDTSVHHHANFAVYLNDKHFDLSGDQYMEEVASCTLDEEVQPKQRVHMHNNNGDLVHVHDHGVTWGHLFQNINWSIAKEYVIDDDATMYQVDESSKLHYILNGIEVSSVTNALIRSEDTLLIYHGTADIKDIMDRYHEIGHTAHEANSKPDPASCAGPRNLNFVERLKKALIN